MYDTVLMYYTVRAAFETLVGTLTCPINMVSVLDRRTVALPGRQTVHSAPVQP
jgi:hypothetical protein